ncbi:MAG: DUF459 domain-containing protein [Thermodesulfobacteriota bacterium]
MKGGRIVSVYALAMVLAVFLQFDRMDSWLSSRFDDVLPGPVAAAVEAAGALHEVSGLTALGLSLDCSTQGLFDGTYKKSYRCREAALAAADDPASGGSRETRVNADSPESDAGPDSPAAKAVTKLSPPVDVLVVGDSLAAALAVSMEKVFKEYEGLSMIPKGKVASGLLNPQYYDWEQALRQFLDEYHPQMVVVMMGANDAKYLALDPESPEPAALADRRRAIYESRLARFISVMDAKGVPSYWIGLPVMGDPVLSAKVRALNALVSQAAGASARCRYVDAWDLLAGPGGCYAQHIVNASGRKVRVREGDKVHFSAAGGDILVRAFLKDAGETVDLRPRQPKQVAHAAGLVRETAR